MRWEDEDEQLDWREEVHAAPPARRTTVLAMLEELLAAVERREMVPQHVVPYIDRILEQSPPMPTLSAELLPDDQMLLMRSAASLARMHDLLAAMRDALAVGDLSEARRLLRDAAANYVMFEALYLTLD